MQDNSSEKEENIAKNLVNNLHKEDFKNRSLSSIDRIIELYFTKYNKNPSEEKEVISFLFKYLKDKKEPASILFRHITNSPERYNIILRLYNEHRWDFNFDVTSASVFLTAFDLIKTNLNLKKILYFFSIFIPFFLIFSIFSYHKVNSLKSQLNENIIQLQNEISNKEKLENELNLLKQNHENEIKAKEQLGSEMNTLKQNMKEEMLTFKQHFESELTSFKEKQQEINELSTCKENLQQEKLNKIQIESELITCKENFESEKLNSSQIESELITCKENFESEKLNSSQIEAELNICKNNFENEKLNNSRIETELNTCKEDLQESINKQKIIEDEFISKSINENKKVYSKFLMFSGVDLVVFIGAILFTYFLNISIENVLFLIISFAFEFAMNLQFFFDSNSVYFYYCFSVIFIISIAILLFVSYTNKLFNNILLFLSFIYIIVASSYKYALYEKNIDFCLLIVFISFVLEMIYVFIIHYNKSDAPFLFIFEIVLFIYYSYFDYSPFFISNISFISFFTIILIDALDRTGKDMLIGLFDCFVTLVKYCFFIFLKQHNKIFYIIISIVIIIEILCFILFKNYYWVLIIPEICLSFLLINYDIFILVFITIAAFISLYWIFDNKSRDKCKNVFSYISILGIILSYAFSLFKFWKMFNNKL